MSSENRFSDYDAFERFYISESKESKERKERSEIILAKLKELILQYIPKGSHIFDLCCGTGDIAQILLREGYQVTGLDGSEVELRYAREKASSAEFILDDARYFNLPSTFHAVISVGASLNYVISIEELESVFHNVYAALLENSLFGFELNMEEDYLSRFGIFSNKGDVQDDFVWVVCRTYESENKMLQERYTLFQLREGEWQRSDVTMQRKAYSSAEVQSTLEKVGFTEIRIYDEERDLGISGQAEISCFVCRKP